ncbi:MAG: formyltetrahydrofolate deformylase [Candidatus Omnitrophica bacterium]|nr:formyltetrahydrofolate deformylase [Candidatus Omnitrophota bacterium]
MNTAILLISSPDQKGITAAITNFIYQNNGNIEHADQHIDSQSNTFFMRVEWSLESFKLVEDKIKESFLPLANQFNMNWELHFSNTPSRVAIFSSHSNHCLYDLLLKYKQNYFNCLIPLIIGNASQTKDIAEKFGLKFVEFPKDANNKEETEKKEIALLKSENIDTVVLARYTQILTEQFIDRFPNRIINIHHSFLPAFIGSNPYSQAYKRGVKIIGATSHYATKELDAGPIIEQDTTRISHRDSVADLKRKGQELERTVLSNALRLHLERKILVYGNKTVVFD